HEFSRPRLDCRRCSLPHRRPSSLAPAGQSPTRRGCMINERGRSRLVQKRGHAPLYEWPHADMCLVNSAIRLEKDSIGGNWANLWTAGVVAQGSFSLVQVSMKGVNQEGSFSIVGRTLTN